MCPSLLALETYALGEVYYTVLSVELTVIVLSLFKFFHIKTPTFFT